MHECMLSNIVSPIYPENWRAFAIFRTLRQYLYSFDMCYTVCTNVGHHTVQEVWKFMWPVVNYKEQEELKFKYSASLWRALFHRRLHAQHTHRKELWILDGLGCVKSHRLSSESFCSALIYAVWKLGPLFCIHNKEIKIVWRHTVLS